MSVEELVSLLEELAEDRKIPRNVRAMIAEAVSAIKEDSEESLKARITTAISILDEASTDPNLQQFSRTEIWNVVSMLESFLQTLEEEG
ncbi:MAG: hypothetical protein GXN99_01350 [Candidatus Nanohaloarchaeota archaeon]|nr:hypothetical protein [Candidatus Nanohaloarchaeota archaeon]